MVYPMAYIVHKSGPVRGVWVHPLLMVELMRYCAPKFVAVTNAIACRYLMGQVTTEESRRAAATIAPSIDAGSDMTITADKIAKIQAQASKAISNLQGMVTALSNVEARESRNMKIWKHNTDLKDRWMRNNEYPNHKTVGGILASSRRYDIHRRYVDLTNEARTRLCSALAALYLREEGKLPRQFFLRKYDNLIFHYEPEWNERVLTHVAGFLRSNGTMLPGGVSEIEIEAVDV